MLLWVCGDDGLDMVGVCKVINGCCRIFSLILVIRLVYKESGVEV